MIQGGWPERPSSAEGAGPLNSIRVVDFTRVIAGPSATQLLGDLGADVIKVENPDIGDESRTYGPSWWNGFSTTFLALNRNKRSVTCDLRREQDRDRVRRLLRDADVVFENFRPGTMARWGLGYEAVAAENPRVIFCSISGFGQSGPMASYAGNNLIAEAFAGQMSLRGDESGPELASGPAVTDLFAGANAVIGVLAALHERERHGKGQWVQTSLIEAQLSLLGYFAMSYFATGVDMHASSNSYFTVPNGMFAASDDLFVLAVNSGAMWQRFCYAVEREDWLTDTRFAELADRMVHKDDLVRELAAIFRRRTRDEWLTVFAKHGLTAAPILPISGTVSHPQVIENNIVMPIQSDHISGLRGIRVPLKFSATPATNAKGPPMLGEHNREIFGDDNFRLQGEDA